MKKFEQIFPEKRFENLSLLDNVIQAAILSSDNYFTFTCNLCVNLGLFTGISNGSCIAISCLLPCTVHVSTNLVNPTVFNDFREEVKQ